jgi:hypothetical protein
VPAAVDKERRGAIYSAAHATEKIVSDLGRVLPGRQRILQPGLRQSYGLCQDQKERQSEPMLIFEDRGVHLPKFATRAGEFSSLCGGFRVGMSVRAFVIPIFDKRDGSFWGTLDMIIRFNWRFQRGHGS